jgi:hypothetical protein
MSASITDCVLANNHHHAAGQALNTATHAGRQPIQPAARFAVVAGRSDRMDARIDVGERGRLQPALRGRSGH